MYGPVSAATVRNVSRERLFAAFFFVVLGLLFYQFFLFLAPFFRPLSWAAILALTFYPPVSYTHLTLPTTERV